MRDIDHDLRWHQRFASFANAFNQLSKAMRKKKYSELEQAGVIQIFAFTFELAWKTMKDILENDGIAAKTPREIIKQAFQAELIEDGRLWLDALEKRNIMAHVYDEAQSQEIIELIKNKYFPLLHEFYISKKDSMKS